MTDDTTITFELYAPDLGQAHKWCNSKTYKNQKTLI